jgi:dynein intermediate chain 1
VTSRARPLGRSRARDDPAAPPHADPPLARENQDGAEKKKKKGGLKKSEPAMDAFDEPEHVIVRPDNQLVLTEKELDEEITKQLTANNPNAPANLARYNEKERAFKFEPTVDQLVVHYAVDGFLLHNESDEAARQVALEELEAKTMAEWVASIDPAAAKKAKEAEEGAEAGAEGADAGADGGDAAKEGDADADANAGEDADVPTGDDSKQLRNQFNFADRASQTVNNPMRDRESETEPPATSAFSESATQWAIYDAYMEDQERMALQREIQKKNKLAAKEGGKKDKANESLPVKQKKPELMAGAPMTKAVRVMERMVNQNSYDDIAQDFKYWEDQSDQFREGEGTLLPLWKFYNEKAKRRHVTCDLLEPGVHRFVRRRVRFVRLREADERFDLLLLAQEPFPPRVRVHHRERRDVPGLPPFALFVASGRAVRRVRVGVRREEQDEPPYPSVRREDGEAHRPGVAGEVAAARREREGSGVHVGFVGRARDALDHVQVRARLPGRDGAQAGGGCRGGGRFDATRVLPMSGTVRMTTRRSDRSPAGAASTSTRSSIICSWWAPRRVACTSARRRTTRSTWRRTRATTWLCTR